MRPNRTSGLGCGLTEESKNTYIHRYIDTYTFRRYISPPRGGAIFEPIDLKFCRDVNPMGVINFAKFGIDRTYGFGVVRGQSLGVPI